PDGRRVLTFTWPLPPRPVPKGQPYEGDVRVWDAITGKLLTPTLPHGGNPMDTHLGAHGQGVSPSFSPGGAWGLTKGNGGARVWSASTGTPLSPPLKDVLRGRFSPDGKYVNLFLTPPGMAGTQSWDVAAGRFVAPLRRAQGPFWDIHADGRRALRGVSGTV